MTSAPAPATKTTGANIDPRTVEGFGEEWDSFDQTELDEAEHQRLFDAYFSIFPWQDLPAHAEGFDLGCGSGRWAAGLTQVGSIAPASDVSYAPA